MAGAYYAVRMPDPESYNMVKEILAYEAAVRGRKVGPTFAEIVFEAVDVSSYPEEVQSRLREISEHAENDFAKGLLPNEG